MSVLFMHYEIEPAVLQPQVPFALDVRDGRAYVSLVAFSQQKLRFAFGGALTAWAGTLAANHDFLNVRTYVREGDEAGIFFLREWVNNRLARLLGPRLYGLPYQGARIRYERRADEFRGVVVASAGLNLHFRYNICCAENANRGDEFWLERYVAFTERGGVRRRFRVAHEPWPQTRVEVDILDGGLLRASFLWWPEARFLGANFSPGVPVSIGRAERLIRPATLTRRWAAV